MNGLKVFLNKLSTLSLLRKICHSHESGNPCLARMDSRLRGNDKGLWIPAGVYPERLRRAGMTRGCFAGMTIVFLFFMLIFVLNDSKCLLSVCNPFILTEKYTFFE